MKLLLVCCLYATLAITYGDELPTTEEPEPCSQPEIRSSGCDLTITGKNIYVHDGEDSEPRNLLASLLEQDEISTLSFDIQVVDLAVSELQPLANLPPLVNVISSDVSTLEAEESTDTFELKSRIGDNEDDITTLQDDIIDLQNEDNRLNSRINDLSDDYDTLSTSIGPTVTGATQSLQADYNDLSTDFSTLEANYDTLKNAHDDLKKDFETSNEGAGFLATRVVACAQLGLLYGGEDEVSDENKNGCVESGLPGSSPLTAGKDCEALRDDKPSLPSGQYYINPTEGGASEAFLVYCDMETDGGGWTIIMATNGNPAVRLTKDTSFSNNAFNFEPFNLPLDQKIALDKTATEFLIKTSTSWLKFNNNLGLETVKTPNSEYSVQGKVTVAGGSTDSTAVMAWSNFNNGGGGEFGIRNTNSFDRHSSSYRFLQSSCAGHYLYDYGPGYDVQTALGTWKSTADCNGNVGGNLRFYLAVRGSGGPMVGKSPATAMKSCKEIKEYLASQNREFSTMSGQYWVKGSGTTPFKIYCDMSTNGGGWSIFYAWHSGSANFFSIFADGDSFNDPYAGHDFNINQVNKMALSAVSTETLIYRTNGRWMKLNTNCQLQNLRISNTHVDLSVTMTLDDGNSRGVVAGWSNYYISRGGDFGVKIGGFDHHSTGYWHLQSGCANHFIYSYGSSTWRAGYDSSISWGSWGATNGCHSDAGGALRFYAAFR